MWEYSFSAEAREVQIQSVELICQFLSLWNQIEVTFFWVTLPIVEWSIEKKEKVIQSP